VLESPGNFTDDNPWWDRDDDRAPVMRPASLWRSLRPGRAVGPVLAGCLIGVAGLFGTPWMPQTAGHVVMLEDSDIGPDRFIALLTQWRQTGRLNDLAGLVIGRRGRPQAAASGYTNFDDALDQLLVGTSYPVVADVDFGHTEPQWSIRLGWTMTMETAPPMLRLDPPRTPDE